MVAKTPEALRRQTEETWQHLQTVLAPAILHAPHLNWSQVEPRFLLYLSREIGARDWLNPLALLLVVLSSYIHAELSTIEGKMYGLHARFRVLFPRYQIVSFQDWDPVEHFPRYFADMELADTLQMRQAFLDRYNVAVEDVAAYLRSLPANERNVYLQWTFPPLPRDLYHQLSCSGVLLAEQQQRRKQETDAIAPQFAQIRGQAHMRWNQLKRLRDKYQEVVALAESGQEKLPVVFSYEEPLLKCRLHFKLWDRSHFSQEHLELYGNVRSTRHDLKMMKKGFTAEKNHFFVEFLSAEYLEDGTRDQDALLWFGDLLRYDLLGNGPCCGSAEEVQRKQEYLKSWGYGEETNEEIMRPFQTNLPGLLRWPGGQDEFLRAAQKRTRGLLFLIEPVYAAATFGLAALDFITTTGARNGEVIQISLDATCLYTVEIESMQRYLVRLRPKGLGKLADYIVGPETQRNLEHVGDFLQEHYSLQPGACIPCIPHNSYRKQASQHEVPQRPYLFQYNQRHFREESINACIRFLCHGLVLQTAEGKQIKLTAHMLRHAFATHLHHVEAVPLDVIAVMLHQKNVRVTAYYAAPPWQQVLAQANSFLDKFATHLGSVEEAFVRSPAELQRQLEEAKAQVGPLNKTIGGECTCYALCPIAFACTGCVYNVPDPNREGEIVEQERWAHTWREQASLHGLGPEVVKMDALIQRCHVTRKEMQLIRVYRKDEAYAPVITIERGGQDQSPLVKAAAPGEARANGAPCQGGCGPTYPRRADRHA